MRTDTTTVHARRAGSDGLMALALVAMLALSGYRAWRVDLALGPYLDCSGCLVRPVLGQDLWLLAALVAAFLLARLLAVRALAWALGLASSALALVFTVDVVVQRLLSRRLLLEDVARYGADVGANLSVVAQLLREPVGWALLAAGLVLVLGIGIAVARAPRQPRRHALAPWLLVFVAALGLAGVQGKTWYLNRHGYENVLAINRPDGRTRPYGDDTLRRLQATPTPALACETGLARPASVIVLVVESLSLHHSQLFSGFEQGLTPRIDALARSGSWYPDFYANGFSTEGGLVALLTGDAPLSGIRYGTTMLFTRVHDDFHRGLAERGWATHFFTTGTLKFSQRQRWLQAIGVAKAEGDEHPAYAGLPRGAFNAASDDALLGRILDWYDHERGAGPFMATVLTVGMHPPFVALDGGETGEVAAVRRTDAAIGAFADALRARGFFDDGLLFVVGDHRMMSPLRRDELARFGPRALVRVPALVVGASGLPPGPVKGDFQQVDLVPSLQYLLGPRSCRTALQGRLFGPDPRPARAQLFADPMRYDQVLARVAGRDHVLLLDGEDTRWRGETPDPGFDLALEVARLRLGREHRPPDP